MSALIISYVLGIGTGITIVIAVAAFHDVFEGRR